MRWPTNAVLRNGVMGLAALALTSSIVSACGSSGDVPAVFAGAADATVDGDNGPTGTFEDGGVDIDAYYFNDPPPQWCGPAGGATPPPPPGGTVECPADKNRQGCACPAAGEVASCWPGPRVNRNLGVCKDGQTTCMQTGELSASWGPCVGAVLPTSGATKGAAACKCFSAGQWDIRNVIPCLVYNSAPPNVTLGAISSYLDPSDASTFICDNGLATPTHAFSADSLKVDCEGTFDLCFVIKAGDFDNPKSGDCEMMTPVCTGPFDYPKKNVVKALPDLEAWSATTPAQVSCVDAFRRTGGYAELSVLGTSYTCDPIDDGNGKREVFHRFKYCPGKCAEAANKSLPECVTCQNGASGQF